MAANNYFGFATHSGTQYAPTGATPYQTTQTGYAVAPTPAAATYTQRAAPAYETYQAAAATHTTPGTYAAVPAGSTPTATTYDYSYAARSAQTAYDTTKTYYQQQTPAAATYSATDYPGWHTTGGNYQNEITTAAAAAAAGKPQYSATYSTQTTRNSTQVQAQKAASYSTGTTAYTAQAQPASNYSSASYSTPPISQQQQPAQNKVVGATLHRNLSTVAEYTQPAQQRQAQTFAPKVKKTFHPQTSVAASSVPGSTPGSGVTSNVTSVTSYPGTTQQTYSAPSTVAAATNSYTQQTYTPAAPAQTAAAKPKPATTTYSGYDAALYSAATMYVAQQATPAQTANTAAVKTTPGNWQGYKKNIGGMMKSVRQKLPPKPQQLHYCDVCKISCAGPQTYREHLEGQKHKKKEASMKAGTTPSVPRGANALRCELCDVTCTGTDAYTAHIRGAKHQKVVKLHTKLGKPIPAADPKAAAAAAAASGTKPETTGTVTGTPKINFIASGNLGTVKTASTTSTSGTTATSNGSSVGTVSAGQASPTKTDDGSKSEVKMEGVEITPDNDITPVGLEYIEEITNDEGKTISFNCKLCECRFNDPNAKGMHMKGRRHRLQFKKKVNPDLVVDVKTSIRQRKLYEEKMRRQAMREDYYRRIEEERASFWNDRMMEVEERIYWEERRRYEEELEYYEWYRRHAGPRVMGPPPPPPPYGPPVGPPLMPPAPLAPPNHPGRSHQPFFPSGPPMPPQGVIRRPDTSDDKHVIARHAAIYPKETELGAVQKIVSHTEKALKLVSDHLTDQANKSSATNTTQNKPGTPASGKPANGPGSNSATKPTAGSGPQSKQTPSTPAVIKKEPSTGGVSSGPGSKSSDQGKREKEDGRSGNLFSFQRDKEDANAGRMLKSVMRVGVLAKGLLLAGDTATDLVMLCADKPTRSLLAKVAANLPTQLKVIAPDDTYTVVSKPDDAAIVITSGGDPKMTVTVTLTSPIIREQMISPPTEGSGDGAGQAALRDPADILNKTKCLEALAALRHAKWFQARVTGLQSCVMVIRILRDLCQRNPTWAPLNSWAMELLAEKVISSGGGPMPPGEALRRIMEALASGILLGSGPGLLDPCEKEQTDATAGLTPQQREDITVTAQHALRLMAFRQIHKVLGMEMLPAPKFNRNYRFTRKRRRDNSSGEGNDSEAGDGKKDKKDEGGSIKMETDKK